MTRMLPFRILLLSSVTLLAGCAGKTPPPEISLDEPATAAGRIIVPAGILSDVIRLLPDGEEEKMEISWSKNHVAFTIGSTYFISNLINGEYPEYQRVIPQSFDAHAELNLHDFAEAVRFAPASSLPPVTPKCRFQPLPPMFNMPKSRPSCSA